MLVRLGQNKRPETDHFLVTKVNGKAITATNKRTGRELRRHLSRFTKLYDKPETPEEVHPEENENDVNPHLRVVVPPPMNVPQDVRPNFTAIFRSQHS